MAQVRNRLRLLASVASVVCAGRTVRVRARRSEGFDRIARRRQQPSDPGAARRIGQLGDPVEASSPGQDVAS